MTAKIKIAINCQKSNEKSITAMLRKAKIFHSVTYPEGIDSLAIAIVLK